MLVSLRGLGVKASQIEFQQFYPDVAQPSLHLQCNTHFKEVAVKKVLSTSN